MKIIKLVKQYIPLDMDITDITLLSTEEYYKARPYITVYMSEIEQIWWLRSQGEYERTVAVVREDGELDYTGFSVNSPYLAVRPALRFTADPELFPIGTQFKFDLEWWTVIGDGLALCNTCLGKVPFRKDLHAENANVYAASDVKKFLDRWLADHNHKNMKRGTSC